MSAQANVVSIQYGTVKLVDKTLAEDQPIYINAGDTLNEGVEVYLSDGAVMTLAMQPSGTKLIVRGPKKWTFIVVVSPNNPDTPYVPGTDGPGTVTPPDIGGPIRHEEQTMEWQKQIAQLRLELVQAYRNQGLLDLAQPHFNEAEHILNHLSLENAHPLLMNLEGLRLP